MDFAEYFKVYYAELEEGYIYIVTNYLIATFIPVLFCQYSMKDRISWIRLVGKICLTCIVMELTGVVLFSSDFEQGQQIVGGLLLLICFAIWSKKFPGIVKTALAFTYAGMYMMELRISISIGSMSGEENFLLEGILLGLNLIFMVSLTVIYRKAAETEIMNSKLMLPVIFWGGVCFLLAAVQSSSGNMAQQAILMTVDIIFLFVQVFVFLFVFMIAGYARKRIEEQRAHLLRQANENMLLVLKDNMEMYNRVRHDMSNQYLFMRTLLENKEYERLREYFMEYSDSLLSPFHIISCENETISVILNMEATKAARTGITLSAETAVPELINIKDTDLSSLLMNIFDNAIEYLENKKSIEDRCIDAEIRKFHKTLMITVTNPVVESEKEDIIQLRTTKAEKNFHGYGTKIIRQVVNKYNGSVQYTVENGIFTVVVMLFEPEKRRKNAEITNSGM